MQPYTITSTAGPEGLVAWYNAESVADVHRGWVLGTFVELPDGTKLAPQFEVKAGTLQKGQARDEWSPSQNGQSFEMVVSGIVEFTFLVDGAEHLAIVHAGECIFWDNVIPHKWRALEPTNYFFVRTL